MRVYLIASKVTDSVLYGFLPAAARLGLDLTVLTNSDHLQTQTALAANYFGLPGQDWRAALRAKDKVLMRRRLAQTGAEHVAAAEVTAGAARPELTYPVVLKPAIGVASEDVMLVHDPAAVERAVRDLGTSGHWEIIAEIAP